MLLHQLFEKRVQINPHKVAVEFENLSLDYLTLDKKANCLASHLLELGLKIEDAVVIHLDRSVEMIIALYAVLKAGGAYVPLDINSPRHRTNCLLEEMSPRIIITQRKYLSRFSGLINKTKVICIDEFKFDEGYKKDFSVRVKISNLAYIIYTSGSTGKQKGAMIEHRGIVNTILSLADKYRITSSSRLLQFANLAFDSSVAEIFSVLYKGGTLVLVKPSQLQSFSRLIKILQELRITVVTFPPTLLKHLDFENNKYLDTLVSAGDICHSNLANKLYRQIPHFINAYGPTECSVCVATFEVSSLLSETVPIGKPIDNVAVYVLDKNMRKVPVGKEGELYVSGVGLARGYFKDKKRTNDVFVPSPFRKREILYKTGDRVVLSGDGNLIFVERVDRQVKIRGLRVELGDVEKQVNNIRNILNAIVVVKKNRIKEIQTVCYYIAKREISHEFLRNSLKRKLPEYMVPNYFIRLNKFPLNSSGKVEVKKLSPPKDYVRADVEYVEPKTKIERITAAIWGKMLNKKQVSKNDNFFELGGESILAMRVVAEINFKFHVDIDITKIFEFPRLQDFTAEVLTKLNTREQEKLSLDTDVTTYYPLTHIQRMFWFMYKMNPNLPFNNVTKVVNIKGKVNVAVLIKSLQYLIERHKELRVNFIERDGVPVQRIVEKSNIKLKVLNIKKKGLVDRKVRKLSKKIFQLETESLLNVTLIKTNSNHNKLVFVMHHIISDAISFNILLSELLSLYDAYKSKKSILLDELLTQFKDYCMWEQEMQRTTGFAKMEEYWLDHLGGDLPVIDIPIDYPHSKTQVHRGRTLKFALSNDIYKSIYNISKNTETSPYMIFFSAFNVFLHRITGQEDLVIGSPVSVRTKREFEGLIGPIFNTIAVRSLLKKDVSFAVYLKKQKKILLNAFRHREYPFEKLVEKLNPDRNLGRNPIFDVMFEYFNEERLPKVKGLEIEHTTYDNKTSKFDFTLSIIKKTNSFEINAEYNTDLFRKSTIERLIKNFTIFLESVSKNYNSKISDIEIMSESERNLVIRMFNDTDYKLNNKTYIQIFEEQVKETPGSIAVQCGNKAITYDELNKRTNQLARYLVSKKIASDKTVGILMDRSVDMIVAILATWKAGGAYVPIETEFPSERVNEIVNESELKVVVSKSRFAHLVENDDLVFNFDVNQETLELLDDKNLGNYNSFNDLAYVIFTSGSTGKPKGVMIEQTGMMNHLFIMINNFKMTNQSVIAQSASHCFDISVWQLVCSLLVGGKTVIYPKEVVLDLPLFIERIKMDGVAILEVVPSFLNLLLEMVERQPKGNVQLPILKYLLITGEVVKPTLVERWFNNYPLIKVINAYGPAEASDDTNFHYIKRAHLKDTMNISIGKPLANIKVYIVDKYLKLCPIGVRGEICIAGIAVGRGYINNTNETRKNFLTDPYSSEKNRRLYRTGDLGRWTGNGNIEFYGREDFQVKVHGFRIELGEIEYQLNKHSLVKEVVVVDKEDKDGNNFLIAYYTGKKKTPSQELRSFLLERLPHYMIPSVFVKLKQLPINNSGKIDRKRLPLLKDRQKDNNFDLETEKIIAKVWKDVLKLDKVFPDDNFFEKGGDSIQSLQIVSKLIELGYDLSIKDIFLYQTIRDLAANIRSREKKVIAASLKGKFPVSPIQVDFFNQGYRNENHCNQAFVFELENINTDYLATSLVELQKYHDSLRLRFTKNKVIYQKYTDEIMNILSVHDLSKASNPDKEYEDLSLKLHQSLNITKGSLIRVGLFKFTTGYKMLITCHHLVTDLVSWKFILDDLETIYFQLAGGKKVSLYPKRSSYKDWVERIYKYSKGEEITHKIGFWREICSNVKVVVPQTLNNKICDGKNKVVVELGGDLTERLIEFAKVCNKKPNVLVLTALTRALVAYNKANKERIVIMLESHGRSDLFDDIDISRTVGWFTSVFPVQFEIDRKAGFIENMNTIEHSVLAVPDYGISYGILRDLVEIPSKDFSIIKATPQIVFNYLGEISELFSTKLFSKGRIVTTNLIGSNNKGSGRIEVDSYIKNKRLIIELRYWANIYTKKAINKLARSVKSEFVNIVRSHKTQSTYKRFNLVNLDEEQLERINDKFD